MVVDLQPVAAALLPLASAAVLAAIPILVPAVLKRLHVANDADLSAKLVTACDAAAGLAYRAALSYEGGLSNVAIHDAALAQGVSYVVARMPHAMQQLGLTPEHVGEMVSARLGRLLASDPTVTAGTPPKKEAPTPAPEPKP